MTKQELYNECDLLTGNINRMCVTDNLQELDEMKKFAEKRIKKIYDYNLQRFNKKDIKMTNRDKINNMTNEEFAKFLNTPLVECHSCMYYIMPEHPCDDCEKGIVEWLESEV